MARTTGVSNPICSPSFRLSVSVSAQQSAFAFGVLSDLYAFHRSTGNSLCPYPLGFDSGLKEPPTDALRPIIPDNACIPCLTAVAGTELADAYSSDTVSSSSPRKGVYDPVADHPLRPATDRHLGKPLPYQLANQTQVPPWADPSFLLRSLWGISSRFQLLSPSQGQVLTRYSPVRHWKHHEDASRPTCMC
ncbi:hypothetical protein KP509_33G038800 [Ceratopteris richardii]|uniref:Uncharacterized protein n=1 Tax=Ceratopteris richardii TaxID=49495 RepID=A0A8T2QNU7_CERRI|nr:hypothetical protein KP509_33G038800 [Ceratopteris richardii]